jgi:hypothetical protein
MRKIVILLAIVGAVFGFSGAMAHDQIDEPTRDCTEPVQTDESSYIGVCIQDVGFVFLGSNGEGGGTIAVDGAKEMGGPTGGPESYLDGYIMVTGDDTPDGNIYCSGNGQFEEGAQEDDSIFLNGGDCLNPGAP